MDGLAQAEFLAEEQYKKHILDCTCLDCLHCISSPDKTTKWLWCDDQLDYVYATETVRDSGCDCFEG